MAPQRWPRSPTSIHFENRAESLQNGARHFQDEIIVLCLRWYPLLQPAVSDMGQGLAVVDLRPPVSRRDRGPVSATKSALRTARGADAHCFQKFSIIHTLLSLAKATIA